MCVCVHVCTSSVPCWLLSDSGRCCPAEMSLLWMLFASRPFMWKCRIPSVCTVLSGLNACSQCNHIFSACCKTPGALQSHFPSLMVQICKREHIVLLHKTAVNPHFPSVSKIIQLIRLPSLISCLWDHKNQNFIGG